MLRADDIHAQIGGNWPSVLAELGVSPDRLRKKAGPCPACGGEDRFTFDNRKGRGDFFCRQCGSGSGFDLLMRVHRWTFAEARREVMRVAGLHGGDETALPRQPAAREASTVVAKPSQRVRTMHRELCAVSDCADAVAYLTDRGLWPLPPECALRAHVLADYWDGGQRIGRFLALVGEVRDITGELVTLHVTYLSQGRKYPGGEPRKMLSPLTGRRGCAVRLMASVGPVLGIAEGIETALSAAALHGVPTWAALNATLLAKFEPPRGIERVAIFADRDVAGLQAAARLMESLQGRVTLDLRVPSGQAKDWNDVLRGVPAAQEIAA